MQQQKVTKSVTARAGTAGLSFSEKMQLPKFQQSIANAIMDEKARQRFVTAIVAAVGANEALSRCDAASVLIAALQGEALGLSPSPTLGEYWIIPYNNRAQFQIGVNGTIQLALRTGLYADINTVEIREGEYKGRNPLTGKPQFSFIPDDIEREKRKVCGYFAYFELTNGFAHGVYFSTEKVLQWADRYSPAFSRKKYESMTPREREQSKNAWYKNFDEMAKNTVLKQALKLGPKSTEMRQMYAAEGEYGELDTAEMFSAGESTQPELKAAKDKKAAMDAEAEFFGDTATNIDAGVEAPPTAKKRGRPPKTAPDAVSESKPPKASTQTQETIVMEVQDLTDDEAAEIDGWFPNDEPQQ